MTIPSATSNRLLTVFKIINGLIEIAKKQYR